MVAAAGGIFFCLYQFCIRLSYSHGAVCICCISPVSDGVIQEKPKHPKALWAFVSLVSYKFSGSMEMLYRDIGACVGAHARGSNSTSDTVIQVLQDFCRGEEGGGLKMWHQFNSMTILQ